MCLQPAIRLSHSNNCSMIKSDLIIIGSGPGGYRSAAYAAGKGLKVVIIEDREAGGTCLNRGCIPTKTLCRHAEMAADLARAGAFGFEVTGSGVDYAKVKERKEKVVQQLREGVEYILSQPGITSVRAHATFVAPKVIAAGGEEYTADHILIATGSQPKLPPIEGIGEAGVLTSDELLELDHVPQSLCIVGAGVIGMEFASIFSSLGCQVTVIEFLPECLPMLDSDVAERLRKAIAKRGVKFYMQSAVKYVAAHSVTFERKGKETTVEAEEILIATGRRPNIDGLGLEVAGVACDKGGICTGDDLQTNVSGVYAIGDVNGRCMLAHAATSQGIHAVNSILGIADGIRPDIMPSAIFTLPEAACVGLSENRCKETGMDYVCHKVNYRANGKALAMGEADGLLKLLASPADGRIIGCHVYGAHASDMVQEISALMCRDTTVAQLKEMIHTHPTIGEMLQDAAEALDERVARP